MVSPQRVFVLKSWLFTPGTRLDRLERAEAAGATALILDLEDSISVADKDKARDNACTWLANAPASGPVRTIRINPVDTSHGLDDLRQLLRAKCQPDYIIVPKVEHAGSLAVLRRLYAGQPDKPEHPRSGSGTPAVIDVTYQSTMLALALWHSLGERLSRRHGPGLKGLQPSASGRSSRCPGERPEI